MGLSLRNSNPGTTIIIEVISRGKNNYFLGTRAGAWGVAKTFGSDCIIRVIHVSTCTCIWSVSCIGGRGVKYEEKRRYRQNKPNMN